MATSAAVVEEETSPTTGPALPPDIVVDTGQDTSGEWYRASQRRWTESSTRGGTLELPHERLARQSVARLSHCGSLAPGASASLREEDEPEDVDEEEAAAEKAAAAAVAAGKLTFRERVHCLFEYPGSSHGAKVVSVVTMAVILASSIILCIETLPQLERRHASLWYVFEVVFVVFFSGDYVIRLWAAPQRCTFVKNGMNVIDLLSVLPFFVDLLTRSDVVPVNLRILRLFRVIRVFRIFKVRRFMDAIAVVYHVLRASVDVLLLGGFMLGITIVVYSTCVYYAEREISELRNGTLWRKVPVINVWEVSPFQSVIHTFWWSIVTITTVGYGDDVPVSPLGKTFASLCMLTGLVITSLPTSIIASNFLRMYKLRQKYGSDWRHYLTPDGQDRLKAEGRARENPVQLLIDTIPHVLHMIDDLESSGALSAVYSTWARRMMRESDYQQDMAVIFCASQFAPNEKEQRVRFARNLAEMVEECAQLQSASAFRSIGTAMSRPRGSRTTDESPASVPSWLQQGGMMQQWSAASPPSQPTTLAHIPTAATAMRQYPSMPLSVSTASESTKRKSRSSGNTVRSRTSRASRGEVHGGPGTPGGEGDFSEVGAGAALAPATSPQGLDSPDDHGFPPSTDEGEGSQTERKPGKQRLVRVSPPPRPLVVPESIQHIQRSPQHGALGTGPSSPQTQGGAQLGTSPRKTDVLERRPRTPV